MSSELEIYRTALIAGAEKLSIEVYPALADAITAHYALVVKWASRMNLTTVTEPARAASVHGVDSLLFLDHLADRPGAVCLDIGSGAGFPAGVSPEATMNRKKWSSAPPFRMPSISLRMAPDAMPSGQTLARRVMHSRAPG